MVALLPLVAALAATLLPLLQAGAEVVTAPTDRLVEFSTRTLPRINQLQPDIVPTILGTSNSSNSNSNSTTSWRLQPADATLRPSTDDSLCLAALGAPSAGSPPAAFSSVALFPCANLSRSPSPTSPSATGYPFHRWQWRADTQQLELLAPSLDRTLLCLSAAAVGLPQTLSVVPCNGPVRWDFVDPNGSPLLALPTRQPLQADSVHPGVRALVERFVPLFAPSAPTPAPRRIMLVACHSWLLDLAVRFTGEAGQTLPIVDPEAPQWSSGNASYADLQRLFAELRTAAAARSLPELQLGLFMVGWATLYNLHSNFSAAHPEAFLAGRLAHGNAWELAADTFPYARFPQGLPAGTSFFRLFGQQWAALSAFLSLDAVMLRDGLSYYAYHGRHGPFGEAASPNASANARWLDGVRELFRQTKLAAPHTTVMGYSLAASAIAQWRIGLSDLEQLAADGFVDAWVTQSWAGAWEDVPTRASKTLGWTHQMAYILLARAQIVGGNRRRQQGVPPCRHYVLHDTFDSYEGFDTIHMAPGKLEWGIWAYTMAALVEPGNRIHFTDGHYLSWANSYSYVSGSLVNPLDDDSYLDRPTGLLTRTDVRWLAAIMASVDASAAATLRLAGPTAVYDRAALERVMATAPADNANEWLDEQLGVLLKYALPVLKVMRLEDGVRPEEHAASGVVLSVPQNVSAELVANLTALAASGAPVVVVGRCDQVAAPLLNLTGAACQSGASVLPPVYGEAEFTAAAAAAAAAAVAAVAPSANVSLGKRFAISASQSGGEALARLAAAADNASGVFMTRRGASSIYAQLSDYTSPVTANLAVSNYGQATPHFVLAGLMSAAASAELRVLAGLDQTQPVTLHLWWTAPTSALLLAGNLEGNFCGGQPCSVPTALTARSLVLGINIAQQQHEEQKKEGDDEIQLQLAAWTLRPLDAPLTAVALQVRDGMLTVPIDLPPAGSRVFQLVAQV